MSDKKPQGRPPKWGAFTRKMDELFDAPVSQNPVVVYTDEELVDYVNMELDGEHRISLTSFRNYKRGEMDGEEITSLFVDAYKRALYVQKKNLMKGMMDDVPGGWQKWAWIMERKFDEWNLRAKSVDETPDLKRLVFRVTEEKGSGSDSTES